MMTIDQQHPEVEREFFKGHFVVHTSCKEFSSIAIDQAHEQTNAVIKDDAGAIGLTEDPTALRRWMIAGSEVSRLVTRYEDLAGTKDATISSKHPEQSGSSQITFFEKVEKLFTVFKEMGNPFEEESADLLVLDTKDIADPANSRLVATHHGRGKDQFESFIAGLKKEEQTLFYQPLKKNKIMHFLQARGNLQCRQFPREDIERGLPPIFPTLHFMSKQTV